jgi:2-oxoglutarate dehydrogenase complex dehydrogenase (E1) component-like enzyme
LEELNSDYYGFKGEEDIDIENILNINGKKTATIKEIQNFLKEKYSNKVSYQFSHLEVKK